MPPCSAPSDLMETRNLFCLHLKWQQEAASGGSVRSRTQPSSTGHTRHRRKWGATAGEQREFLTHAWSRGLQVPHCTWDGQEALVLKSVQTRKVLFRTRSGCRWKPSRTYHLLWHSLKLWGTAVTTTSYCSYQGAPFLESQGYVGSFLSPLRSRGPLASQGGHADSTPPAFRSNNSKIDL